SGRPLLFPSVQGVCSTGSAEGRKGGAGVRRGRVLSARRYGGPAPRRSRRSLFRTAAPGRIRRRSAPWRVRPSGGRAWSVRRVPGSCPRAGLRAPPAVRRPTAGSAAGSARPRAWGVSCSSVAVPLRFPDPDDLGPVDFSVDGARQVGRGQPLVAGGVHVGGEPGPHVRTQLPHGGRGAVGCWVGAYQAL